MTDGLEKVEELQGLMSKCHNIVTTLHFKGEKIDEESSFKADKEVIERLKNTMAKVHENLETDEQFVLQTDADVDDEDELTVHKHKTLKLSCPQRWNSTLEMTGSVDDLANEINISLKCIGRLDLLLHKDQLDTLRQLRNFLKPFEDFTELVSIQAAMISIIPLMRVQITKLCNIDQQRDDDSIKLLKRKVL